MSQVQFTADDLVKREVLLNVSYIVATVSQGHSAGPGSDLLALCEEARELCYPVLDYEEAAQQAGYYPKDGHWFTETNSPAWAADAQDVCEHHNLEPYEWEVFEHWAVSDWLASKLEAQGERIGDLGSLKVWGRTTTGQAISMDPVIQRIHAAVMGS